MKLLLCLVLTTTGSLLASPLTVTYAERESGVLLVDIHLPDSTSKPPFPTILWMHGGGWRQGNREQMKLVEWVTSHGWAIASIDYRLSSVAPFPAQRVDCLDALTWIRSHGPGHGIDPKCVVVSGLSAGAHLASLTGLLDDHSEFPIRGVIHFYGPSDFIQMSKYAREPGAPLNQPDSNVYQLFDGPLHDHLDLAKQASPVTHLDPRDPPLLILVGDGDTLMTRRQCRRLHEASLASGVRSEFHLVEGAGHGGPAFSDPERQSLILNFLNSIQP